MITKEEGLELCVHSCVTGEICLVSFSSTMMKRRRGCVNLVYLVFWRWKIVWSAHNMTYMSNGFLPLLWYVSSHFGHWVLLRPWLFDVRRAHFAWWVRVHWWKVPVATGLHLGCQVFLLMIWNILKGREVADAIGRDRREQRTLAEFET